MALPSNLYIPLQGVQTYFVDKDDGEPLSAGYIEFYSDVGREADPKDVFVQSQLPDGTYEFINVGSVITLSSVGTTQNPNDGTDCQIYLYPYDANGDIELYFFKVFSSGAVLQITREAQPPNVASESNIETFEGSDNLISNPQFVETLLPNTLTNIYTVSGSATETEVAPDWSIITNGSGTVTVTQVPLTDLSMPTGAPFAIRISSAGITSLTLRQTITQSPRLFSDGAVDAYLSGSFVAKSFLPSAVPLIMRYVASNLYTIDLVTRSTTPDSNFNTLMDTPPSKQIITTNNESPNAPGYVNIDIVIPVSADVGITSVQVVSTESANSSTPFMQISVPRQIDHLFHFYKDSILMSPKESFLTGWNFKLNPWQFQSRSLTTITGVGGYVGDQTILIAEVAASLQVSASNTPAFDNALVVKALNGVTQGRFALIQYIDQNTCRPYVLQNLSSMVRALIQTTHGTSIGIKVKLITANSMPLTVNNVTSWSATEPVFNPAVWTTVYPLGNPGNTLTSSFQDLPYNKMLAVGGLSNTQVLGIVVYTTAAMDNSLGTEDVIAFDSISLVPNDFAIEANPQTFDQVLQECEYYYEKSYELNVVSGTAGATTGQLLSEMWANPLTQPLVAAPTVQNLIARNFTIQYKNPKRVAVTPTLVSPVSGAVGVNGVIYSAAAFAAQGIINVANWTLVSPGTNYVTYFPANNNALLSTAAIPNTVFTEAFIQYHYVADARMGVV